MKVIDANTFVNSFKIKPDKSVISQIPIVRMRRMGGQVPNQ